MQERCPLTTFYVGYRTTARHFRRVRDKDRYIVRPNPNALHLWDVIDTMRGGEVVLGGEALLEGQAREWAERLSRHYREWREQRQ